MSRSVGVDVLRVLPPPLTDGGGLFQKSRFSFSDGEEVVLINRILPLFFGPWVLIPVSARESKIRLRLDRTGFLYTGLRSFRENLSDD